MARLALDAMQSELDALKSSVGFVELRQPDGTITRHVVDDFVAVLGAIRHGGDGDERAQRLIRALRGAVNIAELDTFCQAVAHMTHDEHGERRVIEDMSEDNVVNAYYRRGAIDYGGLDDIPDEAHDYDEWLVSANLNDLTAEQRFRRKQLAKRRR
jgi:hypothetical protein